MGVYTTPILVALAAILISYLFFKWLRNPLRKIPGPPGLPIFGNFFSFDPSKQHMILHEMALKYGDVMKISMFHVPVVIINSAEIAYDILGHRGSDFQARRYSKRANLIHGKDLAFSTYDDPGYHERRRVTVKTLKAYGDGVAHLENIIQDTLSDIVDDITSKEGQPIDTYQLGYGFFCCVISSIVFGEQYTYDDPVCQSIHLMNKETFKAIQPFGLGEVLDAFPFLFNQRTLFKKTIDQVIHSRDLNDQILLTKIQEAKVSGKGRCSIVQKLCNKIADKKTMSNLFKEAFDENHMKGVLDHLIAAQKAEIGSENPVMTDDAIRGIMINFAQGGIETSLTVICQAFLDLLHEPELQKRIQDQIDSQFEPTHRITLQDRDKLPLLQAYIQENLRYKTVAPTLLPHATLRDTEVAGYKIPAHTAVLINVFHVAHDPKHYDEPFKLKPERFLDKDGNLVPPGHPARQGSSLGFGSGNRVCIGRSLAENRIFLLLSHLLQKFTIEPAGELPSRDVRNYETELVLLAPSMKVKFTRRQE